MMARKKHLNFALLPEEMTLCAVCGGIANSCYSELVVSIDEQYPIRGLIKICEECGLSGCWTERAKDQLCLRWRRTAPKYIQVVKGKPVLLIVRGKCNDITDSSLTSATPSGRPCV